MQHQNRKENKYIDIEHVTKRIGNNIRFARECRALSLSKMAEISGSIGENYKADRERRPQSGVRINCSCT